MKYGKQVNKQQGTQERKLHQQGAAAYNRSSQRASLTTATSFHDDTAKDKEKRDKKHGHGRHATQRLFP